MGVTGPVAEFLVEAARSGVCFERVATIGRQGLFVGPLRLRRILARHGYLLDGADRAAFEGALREGPWVDPLLRALGAREIVAIDASDYEGADRVHDLNEPTPPDLANRFDLVLDAGSLEHVFNVPVALRSYMEMVAVGGHLVLAVPANNYFGHGFYQFSAELFFRALSEDNGYTLERAVACEHDVEFTRPIRGLAFPMEIAGPRYAVSDAAEIGERVLLQGRRPVLMMVQARRTRVAEIFARAPQQSYYAAQWEAHYSGSALQSTPPRGRGVLGRLIRGSLTATQRRTLVLDVVPRVLSLVGPLRHRRIARRRSFHNRRFFRAAGEPDREPPRR